MSDFKSNGSILITFTNKGALWVSGDTRATRNMVIYNKGSPTFHNWSARSSAAQSKVINTDYSTSLLALKRMSERWLKKEYNEEGE
jgi:glucose dehydrogenase